jgi:dTDP-4-amino-4,6-dideoxygalactose transaminase
VGCFSFYPSKNLGALGDGGALCTDDDDLARRARALRNLGQHRKGEHELLGGNERLDGLQAALLRIKLPHLAAWNRSRAQHAEAYRRGLPSELRLLPERPQAHPVHHLFPVRTPRRDALAAWLSSQGVDTGLHYSPAIHAHPALRGLVHTPVELDRAEQWAAEELSLPMFAELRSDEVERVVEACRAGALV